MKSRAQAGRSRALRSAALLLLAAVLAPSSILAASISGKATIAGGRDHANSLVYIASAPGSFSPQAEALMDQRALSFAPPVLPVVVGTTIRFVNSDDVQHNVFTPSEAGELFNLGTWPKGESRARAFTRMGKVELLCNVHHEMHGYILVLQNPFFALTDAKGNYRIADVPPGDYQLKVWHERATAPPRSIQVAGETVTVDFDLAPR